MHMIINYAYAHYVYPCLASLLERGIPPLKIVFMDIKNDKGGEGLSHWLSYEGRRPLTLAKL